MLKLTANGAVGDYSDTDSSPMWAIIGGAGGTVLVAALMVGMYAKMKMKKKPPASAGGGQAQGSETLSAPAQSTKKDNI